jgi:hypothetical protein
MLQYPHVEFRSDMGGVRLSKGLAIKAKRANGGRKSWPDLFIAQPAGKYCGLFIEIKKSRDVLYKKCGEMRVTVHINEQKKKLRVLRSKGYSAEFGCGFDECKTMIDNYLKQGE